MKERRAMRAQIVVRTMPESKTSVRARMDEWRNM